MAQTERFAEGVEFTAPIPGEFADVLTPDAVAFVAKSCCKSGPSARSG